jgi:hypothetical protein
MQIQYLTSCVAAFLLAALAPVFVVAGLSLSVQQSLVVSVQLSLIAFLISLGHAILLGLPLFLIFQSKRWVNAISSVAGGFIVGIIPGGLLAGLLQSGARLPASVNRVTVVEGMPTTTGWISYIEFVVLLGSFGALAGFVFWLVLKLSGGLAITAQAAEHGSPRRSHAGFRIGFAVIAMLLMGAVVAAPSIVKDRSCHNMFRDDRTTIGVKVRVGLLIGVDDWSKLKMVVEEFSAKRECHSGTLVYSDPTSLSVSVTTGEPTSR